MTDADVFDIFRSPGSPAGHPFVRPGQVAPDLPAPDCCMRCGKPEADHLDEAAIRASERERCAFRLRSVFPPDFMARHGLHSGAGAASVLAAAAAEIEGSGDG